LGSSAQNTVSSPLYDARGRIESLLVDIPCVTDTTTGATTVPCIIPPGGIFEEKFSSTPLYRHGHAENELILNCL
jgi:hypothetical protein